MKNDGYAKELKQEDQTLENKVVRDEIEKLRRENIKLRGSYRWMGAFIFVVFIIQLYNVLDPQGWIGNGLLIVGLVAIIYLLVTFVQHIRLLLKYSRDKSNV